MRVGIFFGGCSREREISFAGGRTIYDSINKELFTPVPIFVDSFGQFILIDWQYIYKGSIRDFYPSVDKLDAYKAKDIQIYAESLSEHYSPEKLAEHLGKIIPPNELKHHIDFAFLALHGVYGEDGSIQGLLQYYNIPFSGSGVSASAIGMSKGFQKKLLENKTYASTKNFVIDKKNWHVSNFENYFNEAKNNINFPLVVRPSNQGSSIGVGILKEESFENFVEKVNDAFFIQKVKKQDWLSYSDVERKEFLRKLCDIRSGIGLPLKINEKIIYLPENLSNYINHYFEHTDFEEVPLTALDGEHQVLIEEFIDGREFSCIVFKNENGESVALPPTEIIKGKEIYDYRSKYLPGKSRKLTPIDLPNHLIEKIANSCKELFAFLEFDVYARIDGFIKTNETVILNDPNTTSGMMPSSFFFHQAAEIGLNPSQFITFIIRNSLKERIEKSPKGFLYEKLLKRLELDLFNKAKQKGDRKTVAVILGGYSSERHISVESGRNIYEKLSSSSKFNVIPVFLSGNKTKFKLHQIPINILLKDNADDILAKINANEKTHPFVENLRNEVAETTKLLLGGEKAVYKPIEISLSDLSQKVDFVFIALHGRPGEDGALQTELEKFNIPYNGSQTESSSITIDKYVCNQLLKKNGIKVADQLLVFKKNWIENEKDFIQTIENAFNYPIICKPVDDGCSSAVKLIKNTQQLAAFCTLIFRENLAIPLEEAEILNIQPKEEIPLKNKFLIENFINKGNAKHFLEITGGLLTHYNSLGELQYEVFEPSEALSGAEILSLEEKFLAGEGQNITPARFSSNSFDQKIISEKVRKDLEKTAKILNVQGYARIDAFVKIFENGEIETSIIEVNSLPGMTPATCIFHQAAINSYKPLDFIVKIIEFGMERNVFKARKVS